MHDWRGKYVKPGTKICYTTRHGSTMEHNIAVVDEVVVKDVPYRRGQTVEKARVTVVESTNTWTPIPRKTTVSDAHITVIG